MMKTKNGVTRDDGSFDQCHARMETESEVPRLWLDPATVELRVNGNQSEAP